MKKTNNIKVLFLILLCCFITPSYAKMSKEANLLYNEAIRFEEGMRFSDAIDLILKALNNSKDDITLTTKLAGLYARNGEADKAIEAYNKAIELNPEDAFLYISLGNIYQQEGDYENAFITYTKAQSLMPDYRYNYLNLANAKFYDEKYNDAIPYYQKFISAYPYNTEAGNLLANSYLSLKDYKNAIEEYEKVKAKNPNNFKEYSELGIAYLRDKQYEKAKENFQKAIELNEKDYISIGNLAVVQSYLKENSEAYANFNKAFYINPDLNELKFDYAKLLENMGKYDEAAVAYQEYIEAKPSDKGAYMNLGILYQKQNNPNYAISVLQKGVKISDDFDIKNELAKSYFQNGEFDKALEIYETELNENSKNLRAAYNKGLCLEAMKQYKDADNMFRKLSYFEDGDLREFGIKKEEILNSVYSNSISWANDLVKQKEYKKAKEIYTNAIAQNPENSKGYMGLAKTYEGLGVKNKVVESYEKAIEVSPDDNKIYMEYGKSLSKMNEEQTAQGAFKKAYDMNNKDIEALELLADSYTKTGNFEGALELYQKR